MKKGVTSKIKQRIESIEGLPCREALNRIYFIEMLTYRKICDKWGINNRTLMRLFVEFGMTPRKGGEAIKTQWINADERKSIAGITLRKSVENLPHPMLGKKRLDVSERMKVNNPMFNLEIRKKANEKTIRTYNENPHKYAQYHKAPTKIEKILIDYFTAKKIVCIGNELINKRFVDIFLPQFNIIVECVGHSRFPLSFDRHKQITSTNINVVYCTNYFIANSNLDIIYNYVTNFDIFSTLPPLKGQETMIFGRRNGIIFDANNEQFTFKTIYVNSSNILRLTAATDN